MALTQPTVPTPSATVPSGVKSAPVIDKELTDDERRAQLEEIRRRMTMSTLSVTPPKGWKARWARHIDTQDIARLEYKGYRIVHDDPGKPRYACAVHAREDGTYVVGDAILMEVPEEIWEFLREEERQRTELMTRSAQEEFINQALSKGVPTFERDGKGNILKQHK